MTHAIGYLGCFERDFSSIGPRFTKYTNREGVKKAVDVRPSNVDGVWFAYMEGPGMEYFAVRAQYGTRDIFLKTPVRLIPERHTDGKGFGPQQSRFGDESASRLLRDIIAANSDLANELKALAEDAGFRGLDQGDAKSLGG